MNLWVQLKFFISDDLQINIDPRQLVTFHDDGNLSFGFDVGVKSFQFCKPLCTLTLTDANTLGVVETVSLEFLSNLPIKKTYNIRPEFNGEGQTMYYFETSCHNQKSFLCKTDEKLRTRSALVTVNHNYSSEKLTLLGAVKARIEGLSEDLNKQLKFENNSNQLITAIKLSVPTSMEETDLVTSQLYLLSQAKDKYKDQDFVGATSLLDKIYVPNMESEWIAKSNQLFQYNQNIQNLKFMLNNSFDETYAFYQKTNTLRAVQMKTLYEVFDKLPKSTFEDIVKLSGLSALKSNLINLTRDYGDKKIEFENELRLDVLSIYSLLNLNSTLNGEICLDVEIVNSGINAHNQNVLTPDASLETYLSFINTSLPQVSANATHLIGTTSIPNDSGKSLSELMGYVSIQNFDYCEPEETLYSNSFTIGQIIFTPTQNLPSSEKLGLPEPKCCIYGVCTTCQETPIPILFLHGHASNKDNPPESSINAFSKIQKQLSLDTLVINAGDIDYDSVGGTNKWSSMHVPVGIRATYYYLSYYDANILSKAIQKEAGVESYSIRLKEIIDMVLEQTNSDKVIIVAHSMGGLVTKNYLMLFGESKVDRVLQIATPNDGFSGRVRDMCSYFGDENSCADMAKDSVFLKKLSYFTPTIPFGVIAGVGCDTDGMDGDGIVRAESAYLDYAKMFYINGECTDFLGVSLHNELLDPVKYPGVYETVKKFILNETFLN